MRTTIDLPDELLRRAKARAALDGTSLKALFTRYVELGLRRGDPSLQPVSVKRSDIPIARPATGRPLPDLSHSELWNLLEDDDVARKLDD